MDRQFLKDAIEAGFTEEQAEFMWRFLALEDHQHEIEDVVGLEDALQAEEEEEEEED